MYIPTWALVGVALVIIYLLNNWFKNIEEQIGLLREGSSGGKISSHIKVQVEPDWFKIIQWLFPELKNNDDVGSFVKDLLSDKKIGLDEETGLFRKYFLFDEFRDGISGMRIIWSHYEKTFVSEPEVHEMIFGRNRRVSREDGLSGRYPNNLINNLIAISPEFIGFHSNLPDGYITDENRLGSFPYEAMIDFFSEVRKNIGVIHGGNYMVAKFPERLQKYLNDSGFKYDPYAYEDYGCGVDPEKDLVESSWLKNIGAELYDQEMRKQSFVGPYYRITITTAFYEPEDAAAH